MENLSFRIEKKLSEMGWTKKKLCAELDITENGFKKMLDLGSIKFETIKKICKILNVPLIFFEDNQTNVSFNQNNILVEKDKKTNYWKLKYERDIKNYELKEKQLLSIIENQSKH
ncbi:MAG: XRE family transcriptional regulator [Cytophagia bacterium]|nr:MAG: XRE family transcriptional regulator [Cytophagia bacterium]TAG46485.1 MAG: XRE family transcriptional regulator [Cytophagia bacterium]